MSLTRSRSKKNEVFMNTATYIKEVNNTPVLFNIDNARDMANLEALQAIKMPENMANEIFGNNIRYADNTTCVITENSGNAEFPFNVRFDASKITAKPQTKKKLTDSYLAGLGMPSSKFIRFTPYSGFVYTAPANGYIHVCATKVNYKTTGILGLHILDENKNAIYSAEGHDHTEIQAWHDCFLPIKKGYGCEFYIQNLNSPIGRFIYAEGEI